MSASTAVNAFRNHKHSSSSLFRALWLSLLPSHDTPKFNSFCLLFSSFPLSYPSQIAVLKRDTFTSQSRSTMATMLVIAPMLEANDSSGLRPDGGNSSMRQVTTHHPEAGSILYMTIGLIGLIISTTCLSLLLSFFLSLPSLSSPVLCSRS